LLTNQSVVKGKQTFKESIELSFNQDVRSYHLPTEVGSKFSHQPLSGAGDKRLEDARSEAILIPSHYLRARRPNMARREGIREKMLAKSLSELSEVPLGRIVFNS
jgi:hypothetical protein